MNDATQLAQVIFPRGGGFPGKSLDTAKGGVLFLEVMC